MNKEIVKKLKKKIIIIFPLAFVIFAGLLFLTAGTWEYREAWILSALIFLPAFLITVYFLRRSPEFLQRRLQFREKELSQRKIVEIANVVFFLGFIVAGFDYRYGWSFVPAWLIVLADVIILFSYYLVFLAFRENTFAARTIEVVEGQEVVRTGPYAVVRHPMYVGIILMYLFIPMALGSFWAVLFFVPVCGLIIARIYNEEEVLKRDLSGYVEYCKEVPYRLVPFVW